MIHISVKKTVKTQFIAILLIIFSSSVFSSTLKEAEAILEAGNGNYEKAFDIFKGLADEGNMDAQAYLGNLYLHGVGVDKNEEKGVGILQELVIKGNVFSQLFMARRLDSKSKYKEAAKLYLLAADQGNEFAQYSIGMNYIYGAGVVESYTKAIEWVSKSAEQGFDIAQIRLGKIYSAGEIAEKDIEKSLKWYTKAAEQGANESAYRLAEIYSSRSQKKLDIISAYQWVLIAAYDSDFYSSFVEKHREGMAIKDVIQGQKLAEKWVEKHRS